MINAALASDVAGNRLAVMMRALGVIVTLGLTCQASAQTDPAPGLKSLTGADVSAQIIARLTQEGMTGAPSLSDSRRFSPCAEPLTIKPRQDSWRTVEVSCAKPTPWRTIVRSGAEPMGARPLLPPREDIPDQGTTAMPEGAHDTGNDPMAANAMGLALVRSMKRGETIAPGDLALVPVSGPETVGIFSDPNTVLGRRLKASLSLGQLVKARHLELDWLVEKDQEIVIEIRIGGVSVSVSGQALSDGQYGEDVTARNLSSGQVVQGVVVGPKKIAVMAKGN